MKRLFFLVISLSLFNPIHSQVLKGNLKLHSGQEIKLFGFHDFDSIELSQTLVDSSGNFTLPFEGYTGMGVLQTQDNTKLVLALLDSTIVLNGTHLNQPDSLIFIRGDNNIRLVAFAKREVRARLAYKAWRYLRNLYHKDSSNLDLKMVRQSIDREITRLEMEERSIDDKFKNKDYLDWFLKIRKLIYDMPESVYRFSERIPKNIDDFRKVDFNNNFFVTSGLLKDLIFGHFLLLENMGKPIDSIYAEMNVSVDSIILSIKADDELLNSTCELLFDYFESRGLFKPASYLSNKILNLKSIEVNPRLTSKMEKYRTLRVGNVAPDIRLPGNKWLSNLHQPILLVFGAGWCQDCRDQLSSLKEYYEKWKKIIDIEVVYISLDTDSITFNSKFDGTPWITFCDFEGWETQAVKDFFVTATPTYILLDDNMKILEHPRSLEQVDAWVKFKLRN